VYEIALSVAACLRAGTHVDVAWAVEARGFSSRDRTEALAITPGGGRIGSVMSGALNDQLAALVGTGLSRQLVDLHVGEVDALIAGLSCGGDVRCLIVPAEELPGQLWERLRDRAPICLLTHVDRDHVVATTMFDPDTITEAGEDVARLFARGVSNTAVLQDTVVTVLWPIPRLVIAGAGTIAEALAAAAGLLGWQTQIITEAEAAVALIAELSTVDKVVVISHDVEFAGPVLAGSLAGGAGYIGALGSRATQQTRAEWLADRGVTALDRIHGPAGLDVGARTPAEIAVSILAEALAVQSGATAGPLRDRTGAINRRVDAVD
jgi:xanthine dehydrogenase accessory factor